jgi:hypothetical protein
MAHEKRILPTFSSGMSNRELTDYCHISNWTSDPVISELVSRLDQTYSSSSKDILNMVVMTNQEIAVYCDTHGLSDDPLISFLTNRLWQPSDEKVAALRELFKEEIKAQTEATLMLFRETVKNPVQLKKPRPGPKPKYLPLILRFLRIDGPAKKPELVLRVIRVYPNAGKGAIYRVITKAVEDGKIIALDNLLHHPR